MEGEEARERIGIGVGAPRLLRVQCFHASGVPRLIGCGPNGGPAVRTPRAAEPEGEREVWRERLRGRVYHAWPNPPSPEPRAPQRYTFESPSGTL